MRIILAGAQSNTAMDWLEKAEPPSILMSYYYMRSMSDLGEEVILRAKEKGQWLLVDSGAFTFKMQYKAWSRKGYNADGTRRADIDQDTWDTWDAQLPANATKATMLMRLDTYFAGYVDWLKKFAPLVDAFAELDLDELIGEQIWDWRETIRREVDIEKTPVIITPGWIKEWDRIFDEGYQYVGIPGRGKSAEISQWFTEWMPRLKEKRIKVHGWALTSYKGIVELPFYSVDSTSWLMGGKFGTTHEYLGNGKMRTYSSDIKEKIRSQLVHLCDAARVDKEAFLRDEYAAVHAFNAHQWALYARDMEAYNTNAYWLTEEERAASTAEARKKWNTSDAIIRHNPGITFPLNKHPSKEFGRYCNTCFLNQKCPAYQRDATCSITGGVAVQSDRDVKETMIQLFALQTDRVMFGAFAEKVSGTPLDAKVDDGLKLAVKMASTIDKMGEESITLTAKTKGGGLISKLFGDFGKPKEAALPAPPPEPVDVTPAPVVIEHQDTPEEVEFDEEYEFIPPEEVGDPW